MDAKEGEKVEMRKEWKKEKYDMGEKEEGKRKEKREWKETDKWERKDGGKTEWREKGKEKDGKKGKYEHGKEGKEWKEKEKKKEWKKEKSNRGDEGKPWKDREGGKEWKEKNEWKERKEGKEWKKDKKKDGKPHKEWREDETEKKDWRKVKRGHKEEAKTQKERDKKEWRAKGERKEWKREDGRGPGRQGKDDGKDWKRDGGKARKEKPEHKTYGHEKHRWGHPGDGGPAHTHPRPSVGQPAYWDRHRQKMQHSPAPRDRCDSVETCAQAEGLRPVRLPEFQAFLRGYLTKAEGAGVEAARSEELGSLAAEFFRDGVFVHDQMSFREFAEDVGDILEDMVEGEEEEEDGDNDEEEEEEDSAIEREMDEFETEVMKKFSAPERAGKEERKRGEWKERGRGRG